MRKPKKPNKPRRPTLKEPPEKTFQFLSFDIYDIYSHESLDEIINSELTRSKRVLLQDYTIKDISVGLDGWDDVFIRINVPNEMENPNYERLKSEYDKDIDKLKVAYKKKYKKYEEKLIAYKNEIKLKEYNKYIDDKQKERRRKEYEKLKKEFTS